MDSHMGVMQESMLKMYKIMDAKNPQEREQLMQAHREIMRQHRQAVKGMMGQRMMGDDEKSGGAQQETIKMVKSINK